MGVGDLTRPQRWLAGALGAGLLLTAALNLLGAAPEPLWARAQLTIAAALALLVTAASIPPQPGRVRAVRIWVSMAIGLWLVAELVRNVEVAGGSAAGPGLADLFLAGVLSCATVTYVIALRGQVERSEEIALYLDAAIVFFGVAAVLLTAFGEQALAGARPAADLAYVVFFISTSVATLLLDVTVRAERRARGAYAILAGLTVLGFTFLLRVAGGATEGLPEDGAHAHLSSLGLLAIAYGTLTWSDLRDDDEAYALLAARLRAALPLVAVSLTPALILAAIVSSHPLPLTILKVAAIALVVMTVAIRQSLLLREREAAVSRERRLAEELKEAESRYRALVERQPGVVYLAEPGEQGRWHYVSPQIEQLLGYPRQAWLDDPGLWASRIHPDDRQRILGTEGQPSSDARYSEAWEYRMLAADGREVWVLDDEAVTECDEAGRPTMVQGVLLDITERKHAEEALRASEDQTRRIIESASYAFVGMDADGRVVDWNQRATDTFGWPREEAMGHPVADLILPPESRSRHQRGLSHYLATGEGPYLSQRVEVTALHRDGRRFPVELTIWPVKVGDAIRFNALIDDITARKQLEQQLRHQALHDALTGLPNRVLFADRLEHALDRMESDPTGSLAVLFLDLDDFKEVNDTLGHTAGDQLLAAVAGRLSASLRPEDTAARLGGDEFGILIEDGVPHDPSTIATRLRDALARPFDIDGTAVSIRASIGISLSGPNGDRPEELLRNADLAMYLAKARGKNRHELYTPGMHEQAQRRVDLKRRLEGAISNGELEVHYQPVVFLDDGTIVGLEALLRWPQTDGTAISPSEIVPIAEETGLIGPIGQFVLERACRDVAVWRAELPDDERLDVAVNVSPVELEQGSLAEQVTGALRGSGLDAGSLVLELTESALTNDSLDTVRSLRELRRQGVRIALDDFGTGYSSLARLRRFPVDIVKIDRGFTAAVGTERGDPIVQSIVDLGRSLGMEVVAEGIETSEQRDVLWQRGVLLGQGHHYSPAVPPAAIGPMLALRRLPVRSRRPRPRRLAAGRA